MPPNPRPPPPPENTPDTKTASIWFRSLLASNSPCLVDFELFINDLRNKFSDPSHSIKVRGQIRNCKQGSRSASAYAAEFSTLTRLPLFTKNNPKIDWINRTLEFKKEINSEINAIFGVLSEEEVQSSDKESNHTEYILDSETEPESESCDTDQFFDATPNLTEIAVEDIADDQSTVPTNINV
ncbi:hypothetical protein AYI70_g12214 [Smittium culicis]|uniref:Retrotransposon gag domain-containing protein n=1 Tax=Smittium culicis TaxID=133412 RepID=A0A1R1WYF7_9FUNG|nr:hypothetical protein AYI70_g12214 [Smittium culicis]